MDPGPHPTVSSASHSHPPPYQPPPPEVVVIDDFSDGEEPEADPVENFDGEAEEPATVQVSAI